MPRKKISIDWDRVEKMAMAGANGVQIAAALGIHYNTLDKRSKEDLKCDFSEYLTTKREKGNELLLRKQYDIAMSGDKTMLVWLGKQRLEQKEHQHTHHGHIDFNHITEQISDSERLTDAELKLALKLGISKARANTSDN